MTMRQGMDRGRSSPDRKGTSRVSKPSTGRMNAQGAGTRRGEAQEQGTRSAPPADNKNTLYIGIGGGALVFVLILAFMLSGGEAEHKSGVGSDKLVNRAIEQATLAHQRGEYRAGLDICEQEMDVRKAGKND